MSRNWTDWNPGGGDQHVPELEEVERGHRLEDVDLVDEEPLDDGDPLQPGHDLAHVFLGHHVLAHHLEDDVELEEDLLEPQLEGLVGDDEEQFVVGRRLAEWRLGRQQPVELEVVEVVEGFVGGRHRATLPP
jgi:hypothetical protein